MLNHHRLLLHRMLNYLRLRLLVLGRLELLLWGLVNRILFKSNVVLNRLWLLNLRRRRLWSKLRSHLLSSCMLFG